MKYSYKCTYCSGSEDLEFPMGKAPETTVCSLCRYTAKRVFHATSVHYQGGTDFHDTTQSELNRDAEYWAKRSHIETPG